MNKYKPPQKPDAITIGVHILIYTGIALCFGYVFVWPLLIK